MNDDGRDEGPDNEQMRVFPFLAHLESALIVSGPKWVLSL